MEARLIELAELLRQNGVRVSSAEVVDGVRALALVGLAEREAVRGALKATMLKRAADHALFDRLFDLQFSGLKDVLDGLETSVLRRLEEEGVLEGDELEMLLYTLREMSQRMSPLAQAALDGDEGQIARLFRGAAFQLDLQELTNPLQAGFFARRLASGAGLGEARKDLDELVRRLEEQGIDPARIELVGKRLADRLREVEAAARRYVEQEAKARGARQRLEADSLASRSFAELSREELERTELAVRRLAEKLKSRLIRKQSKRRRGALNVQRTLRRNMGLGGIPMSLVFRNKRPQRPDVIVLCDVSDSVRNVSRLMLLFVHTLQARFTKVRSFAFVSDIGEITEAFKGTKASEAVDPAVAGSAINLYANSNYGRAFALFVGAYLGSVTKRTSVLIIGDGRNNYNAANVWALEELRRRARRVVWICPEERSSWSFGDSEMPLFERAVDQVVVVRNLADLEAAASSIVTG